MLIEMCKAKISNGCITACELHYEGSITIDESLLEDANIVTYEKVDIYNVSNGERFSTYAIKGKRGSGVICLNGAAARKASKGDLVIIASYVNVEDAEAQNWKPKCIFVDHLNKKVLAKDNG